MNALTRNWILAAAVVLTAGGVTPASASKVVSGLDGTVNSASSFTSQITVNGVVYPVKPSPEMRKLLSTLHAGDHVQLLFDGPPGSKALVTGITKD
jgi:hypothetical protein